MMEIYVILIVVFWVLPIVFLGLAADRAGKNVWLVVLGAGLLGWVGGLLAYLVLPGETVEERWAREDEALEKERKKAALRAMGEIPERSGSVLSEARKRELEKYLGGPRR